jgi:hypothetical protein
VAATGGEETRIQITGLGLRATICAEEAGNVDVLRELGKHFHLECHFILFVFDACDSRRVGGESRDRESPIKFKC